MRLLKWILNFFTKVKMDQIAVIENFIKLIFQMSLILLGSLHLSVPEGALVTLSRVIRLNISLLPARRVLQVCPSDTGEKMGKTGLEDRLPTPGTMSAKEIKDVYDFAQSGIPFQTDHSLKKKVFSNQLKSTENQYNAILNTVWSLSLLPYHFETVCKGFSDSLFRKSVIGGTEYPNSYCIEIVCFFKHLVTIKPLI